MKYLPYPPISLPNRQWPNNTITTAPTWCSVDLRDGNQSLPDPMDVDTKIKFFTLLCQIGFKEIEVGFPASSDTEFAFCRRLIEENLIPDDVTIQVLVQARPTLITTTFAAVKGAKQVIIHVYNSTNPAQREIVFGKTPREITDMAVEATACIAASAQAQPDTQWTLQYSPESFSLTEPEFAAEICNAVIGTWRMAHVNTRPIIINLPSTVESSTPNVYADQIEWVASHLHNQEKIILSVHTHNDRGTGIAATELALLAGATRVEGTLFGNGERTGNADIVTLALNLHTQGIDPQLNFKNLPAIVESYCKMTGMTVHDRHPYAGALVLTAFSGSHQDAIAKGLAVQKPDEPWRVPYLPFDPADIGREYEKVIRINSQSGKGGVNHILQEKLGIKIPKDFHPEIGAFFKSLSDTKGSEISEEEILSAFLTNFVNVAAPHRLDDYQTFQDETSLTLKTQFTILHRDRKKPWAAIGRGNGPLDALTKIFQSRKIFVEIQNFEEHAAAPGSNAQATAFIKLADGRTGIGIDPHIERAALKALVCAVNKKIVPNS